MPWMLASCQLIDEYHRGQQIRTQANLQSTVADIEHQIEETGTFDIGSLNDSVNRDGWGNKFIIDSRETGRGLDYVVISTGRDGVMDLADINEYHSAPPKDVSGSLDHDIVFRNGRALWSAGK